MNEYSARMTAILAILAILGSAAISPLLSVGLWCFMLLFALLKIAVILTDIRDGRRPEPEPPVIGSKSDWA